MEAISEHDRKILEALKLVFPAENEPAAGMGQLILCLEKLDSDNTGERFEELVEQLSPEALKYYCWQLAKQLLEPSEITQ